MAWAVVSVCLALVSGSVLPRYCPIKGEFAQHTGQHKGPACRKIVNENDWDEDDWDEGAVEILPISDYLLRDFFPIDFGPNPVDLRLELPAGGAFSGSYFKVSFCSSPRVFSQHQVDCLFCFEIALCSFKFQQEQSYVLFD